MGYPEVPQAPLERAERASALAERIFDVSVTAGSRKIVELNEEWKRLFTHEQRWASRAYHKAIGSSFPAEDILKDSDDIDAVILADLERVVVEMTQSTSATLHVSAPPPSVPPPEAQE